MTRASPTSHEVPALQCPRAAARPSWLACVAALAGIQGRNKLEAGRITHMRIGARDDGLARLHRLPERLEHRALEFREFVEEQDALVGQ